MAFGFYRGIWITLRAANYTSQAMNDASKGLNKVQQAQVRLAKSSVQLGLMYIAMGAMAAQGIVGIIQFSERGKQLMSDFSESIEPALMRLSHGFADILERVLPLITAFMNLVTITPLITQATAVLTIFGIVLLIVGGIVNTFRGGIKFLGIQFGILTGKIGSSGRMLETFAGYEMLAVPPTLSLAAALQMVAISAGAGLAVFMMLQPLIGNLPALLFGLAAAFGLLAIQMWSASMAINTMTGGALAIAGMAAMAGAFTMLSGMSTPTYDSGTTMVRRTGLGMLKAGEIVFDPINGRPQEIMNDMSRGGRGASSQNINITIENVHTKADIDDLDEEFGRRLRRGMRSNR